MDYCAPRGIPHSEFLTWDVDDQSKALHWTAEEAQRCSGCGTADWEWLEDNHAYEAHTAVCLGCLEIGSAQKDAQEQARSTPGLKTYLRKRPEEVGRGGDT